MLRRRVIQLPHSLRNLKHLASTPHAIQYNGTGLCNPWPADGTVQILKGYCQSSGGGQRVVYPRSLTHAAVARGLIWLCAVGPAVLHGCTPLK